MPNSDYFAEMMTLDAINFNLNKYCKANILLAGPICSGKLPIVDGIKKWFSTVRSCNITLMNQASFYKPLHDIPTFSYGYNIDCLDAFYTDEFVKKVNTLFEKGITSSPYYNFDTWVRGMPEMEKHCTNEEQLKKFRTRCELFTFHSNELVNIFFGTHVIFLLDKVVPNNCKIFLNTNFDTCMKRRLSAERYAKTASYKGISGKRDYSDAVWEEVEWSIMPQKEMADLVIKEYVE